MLQVKGRFSVPWSVQNASGFVYPGAFLFGEGVIVTLASRFSGEAVQVTESSSTVIIQDLFRSGRSPVKRKECLKCVLSKPLVLFFLCS